MADNHALFSTSIDRLKKHEHAWLKKLFGLEGEEVRKMLGEVPEDFDDECWPGFEADLREDHLWLYSEEGYNEIHLCAFLVAFIKKFRPDTIMGISVSFSCSKPRLDEFGGGWLVISREGVRGGSTWDSISEARDNLLEARGKTNKRKK